MSKYLHGIDVSGHQGDIQWGQVAAAGWVKFVYIKASEHVTHQQKTYNANRQGCRSYGIPSGAYHFAQLGTDPVGNAHNFSEAIGVYGPGDLYPCLDVESMGTPKDMSHGEQQQWMLAFATEFRRLRKLPLVLYGSSSLANGNPAILQSFPYMWVAQWPKPLDFEPPEPSPKVKNYKTWSIWQYSDKGAVPGIVGDVDMDVMRPDDLSRLTIGGGNGAIAAFLAAVGGGLYYFTR